MPDVIETTNEQFEELKKELVRPFKLEKGRLFRAQIYVTEDRKYLFTDFHHIIADGNSYDIIFEDINRAYVGEKLEKETYTGFDAALDGRDELDVYSEMLETGIDIKMVRKYLGDDVADHMKDFCKEHGLI